LNRHDAKVAKGAMFRTLDRRTRKPVYGAFRSSVPLPPLSHFGLGVPGTQRQRWVSLAVENFGLGLFAPQLNRVLGVVWRAREVTVAVAILLVVLWAVRAGLRRAGGSSAAGDEALAEARRPSGAWEPT